MVFTHGERSRARDKVSEVDRIMYKMKKPQEDLFEYELSEVNCWCDLRATRSIRLKDLEPYFGCPLERENKGCGYFETLVVREAVDKIRREKDKIILAKDKELDRAKRDNQRAVREKDEIIRRLDQKSKNNKSLLILFCETLSPEPCG
ncbi:hypothetical protein LINPERHAP1_LOCUS6512 [Linum perenne]